MMDLVKTKRFCAVNIPQIIHTNAQHKNYPCVLADEHLLVDGSIVKNTIEQKLPVFVE